MQNVIITEKNKKLLKDGVSVAKAIEDGYSNAMRAILDPNITTLLAAVILYAYGTGPIKGFAITSINRYFDINANSNFRNSWNI